MAAPDETPLKNLINSNLPDPEPGKVRRISPAILRATLFQVIDWVKTGINNNLTTWLRISDKQPGGANTDWIYRIGKAVFGRDFSNGTAAALEASTAWIDNLNGNKVSPWFTITQPGDGLAPTQYYAFCELAAPSGGTYDYIQVEFVGKPWSVDSSTGSPIELSLMFTNRGGFKYQYTSRGDGQTNGCGIICQQMPDGRIVVYMVADNAFKVISARVSSYTQAIIYDSVSYKSSLTGLGTEVFNSTKPGQYRPVLALRGRFTAITMANSDGGWPAAPINEPGSAQLSFGANWVAGSSEVALINSNLAGSGFSFWQQTGATAKRMLAHLNGAGDLLLGGMLRFTATVANRKIVLFTSSESDHQFFGFGVNNYVLRYQVPDPNQNHIFYAALTALTSAELMRIQGDGKVLIGLTSANDRDTLQVGGSMSARYNEQNYNPTSGEVPAKSWRVVKNTANGETRLWVNDGGTMKSVLLS